MWEFPAILVPQEEEKKPSDFKDVTLEFWEIMMFIILNYWWNCLLQLETTVTPLTEITSLEDNVYHITHL